MSEFIVFHNAYQSMHRFQFVQDIIIRDEKREFVTCRRQRQQINKYLRRTDTVYN